MSRAGIPGWSSRLLGDIAKLRRGITYSASLLQTEHEGIPYINMKSFLKGGGLNLAGTKYYNGPYAPDDILGHEDVVIANTDVTAGDIIGVPAILPTNFSDRPVAFSHHVTRVRILDHVIPAFLYYLLCLPEYRSQMMRIARGTTVLMLDMQALKRIPIIACEQAQEQRRIAEVLTTIDDAIAHTEALIDKTQKIKAGLMHDLFTRGVTLDGKLRPPREEAPALYKESPLGWIPKEWEIAKIGELYAEAARNGLYKPARFHGKGPLMVQMGNMFRGLQLDLEGASRVDVTPSELAMYGLGEGDLLFGRRSLVLEGAGKCVMVGPLSEPATFESSIIRARLKLDRIVPEFAAQFLSTEIAYRDRRKYIRQVAVSGISGADLKCFLLPLPRKVEQFAICSVVNTASRRIEHEQDELFKNKMLKSGLMRDLLTGEVRLPVDPTSSNR